MLISLHMPKTAGNSFLQVLEKQFGDNLVQDYADMSIIQRYLSKDLSPEQIFTEDDLSKIDLSEIQCIHGHFLPAKFLNIQNKDLKFVTWLRDPVDRLFSHYNFFKRSYDPLTAGPLFKKIIEENWSVEKFCFSYEYKNIYTKYLLNFSYDHFDFIGLTEFYEADLKSFSEKFLNIKAEVHKINCATVGGKSHYNIDPIFRQEIEEFHSEDVALYQRAYSARERRI